MTYQWHHVENLAPPKGVYIIGNHSEWLCPLTVIKRGNRWYFAGPDHDRLLSAYGMSKPLHWARMPVGYARQKREAA